MIRKSDVNRDSNQKSFQINLIPIKLPLKTKNICDKRKEKPKFNDKFKGRKFKRSAYIVEEEFIFKKKIISIFEEEEEEGETNENSKKFDEPFFTNNNEKESTIFSRLPRCFTDCFDFKKAPVKLSDGARRNQNINWEDLSDSDSSNYMKIKTSQNDIPTESASTYQRSGKWKLQDDLSDAEMLYTQNKEKCIDNLEPVALMEHGTQKIGRSSHKTDVLPFDPERSFMKALKSTPIIGRYCYSGMIGEGTFGKVISCFDKLSNNEPVAIKVSKKQDKYRKLAQHEVQLLSKIKKYDPNGENHVIIMTNWLEIDSHIMLIFPQYGEDLYNYLKSINHHGMKLCDVKHISCQMWKAVDFLHKLTIIHTDIKPENLLFVSKEYKYVNSRNPEKQIKTPISPDIVLIDLGNGIHGSENKPRIIVTRYYRPPEVYLEVGWGEAVDVWSMGCVMYELYSGRALFQCHGDREHMWMMEYLLKEFPESLIRKSKVYDVFFDEDGHVLSNELDLEKLKKPLSQFKFLKVRKSENEESFVNLIMKCLRYNPHERVTTKEALRMPFLSCIR